MQIQELIGQLRDRMAAYQDAIAALERLCWDDDLAIMPKLDGRRKKPGRPARAKPPRLQSLIAPQELPSEKDHRAAMAISLPFSCNECHGKFKNQHALNVHRGIKHTAGRGRGMRCKNI
jgi:hypothetical protein